MHKYINERHSLFDTYLYGRRAYERVASVRPGADADPAAPDFIVEAED